MIYKAIFGAIVLVLILVVLWPDIGRALDKRTSSANAGDSTSRATGRRDK